jgi:MFS family permease
MPSMMVATLGIALPEIRETFSLSTVAAGSLFSVMMIIAALTSGIAGRLADKFGRKTVLITGLSLLAAGFGLAGVSTQPIRFFVFLAVTGIGYGFTPPSLYALMSDLLPNRRGLAASLVSVTYGIGGAIGAVLASRIIAASGWRAAFTTVGVIAAADMLLQLYWIRDTHRARAAGRSGSFKDALSLPLFLLAIAEFIGGSVFWSSAAWTPTALRTAKALSLQQTGWIMSVLSLANMLGSFSLGSLSDKFGRKLVIAFSAFPAALAAFIVFYWLQSPVGLAVGIFVFGIFKASVPALVVALAQEAAPPGSAGTASGIIMSLHYTAGVIAPLLAAKVIGATGDIILAMILATTVPLLIYGSLIALVREPDRLERLKLTFFLFIASKTAQARAPSQSACRSRRSSCVAQLQLRRSAPPRDKARRRLRSARLS